jgi:aminoglycoside phosphotransferase (APT) family kinase protein
LSDLPAAVLAWLGEVLETDASILDITAMPAASTQMHEISFDSSHHRRPKLVVRRFADVHRLRTDPFYDPVNETRALRLVGDTPIPAPHVIAADLDPKQCDVPTLLLTWVPGAAVWIPDDVDVYLRSAAAVLTDIHGSFGDRPADLPGYLPYAAHAPSPVGVPTWSRSRSTWERALEVAVSPAPSSAMGFIHRDFHAGNALSERSRVVSVVDWPTAAWGPLGIDLARMRQNLAFDVDPETAERFLSEYEAAGGHPSAYHPFWDIVDAADDLVGVTPPATSEEAAGWERLERWLERALAELG